MDATIHNTVTMKEAAIQISPLCGDSNTLKEVAANNMEICDDENPCVSIIASQALDCQDHCILNCTLEKCMSIMSHNGTYLLRTGGGLGLPVEIVLHVVEMVLEDDPADVATFNWLIRTYEKSITHNTVKFEHRFAFCNFDQSKILGCSAPPNDAIITKGLNYSWYTEMRTRHKIIKFLSKHEITAMDEDDSSWPRPENMEGKERLLCEQLFKQKGFLLLFRLSDCTADTKDIHEIRRRQRQFLESLTATETATLCCLVEVVGTGFFDLTRTATRLKPLNAMGTSMATGPTPTSSPLITTLAVPGHSEDNDHGSENWLRECMCVFEDRMQRYGPYFAYIYLIGSKNKKRRPDLWAKAELQTGLDEMNAYELGNIMAYASLQSVTWKSFCRKAKCTMPDRWIEAKALVEQDMEMYFKEEDEAEIATVVET